MEFSKLQEVLNEYIKEVGELYKTKLRNYGKDASGELIRSVSFNVVKDGNEYVGELSLADYWKYVEFGTEPHFPPVDSILKWIQKKPIIPKEVNGIKPTNDQLAYLIGRKISEDGIQGVNALEQTIEEVNEKYASLISDAVSDDLENELDKITF